MLLLQTTGISMTTVSIPVNTLRQEHEARTAYTMHTISERKDYFQGATSIHTYFPLNKCEVCIGEIYIGRVFFLQVHGPNSRPATKKFEEKNETDIFTIRTEAAISIKYLFK